MPSTHGHERRGLKVMSFHIVFGFDTGNRRRLEIDMVGMM